MSFRTGTVAIVGKPNVGKSTIINALVGQKVSIVSNKPQTTRRKVMGIVHGEGYELALLDTPGIHAAHNVLGREMLDAARSSLEDADVVLYVADVAHHPGAGDQRIAEILRKSAPDLPVVLALNKMDLLSADRVEPHVDAYCKLLNTEQFMLTTATKRLNLTKLVQLLVPYLPEGEQRWEEDEFTNQPMKFMAAELIREKILAATKAELPYSTAVLVEEWNQEETGTLRIRAVVYVERASQRGILLGKQGQFIKKLGTDARLDIETLTGSHVFLELFVKVAESWRQDRSILQELEYRDSDI